MKLTRWTKGKRVSRQGTRRDWTKIQFPTPSQSTCDLVKSWSNLVTILPVPACRITIFIPRVLTPIEKLLRAPARKEKNENEIFPLCYVQLPYFVNQKNGKTRKERKEEKEKKREGRAARRKRGLKSRERVKCFAFPEHFRG